MLTIANSLIEAQSTLGAVGDLYPRSAGNGLARDHRCYSKYHVANRRQQVRASAKINVLAAAVALTAAVTSCSASGGTPSAPASSADSAAPLSQAALVAGSRHETGLVIYSNALLSQMQQVTKAFQATYPW